MNQCTEDGVGRAVPHHPAGTAEGWLDLARPPGRRGSCLAWASTKPGFPAAHDRLGTSLPVFRHLRPQVRQDLPMRPGTPAPRATPSPELVRSRLTSRLNSANAPTLCMIGGVARSR
ncbi:hypothetical protein Q0M94_06580 [Deinococcus radiomollis]|uniref:hypothetical protein n=1 Tax=Deinococcus radiomollis TaxID=468916 RepID=UPI003892AB9C